MLSKKEREEKLDAAQELLIEAQSLISKSGDIRKEGEAKIKQAKEMLSELDAAQEGRAEELEFDSPTTINIFDSSENDAKTIHNGISKSFGPRGTPYKNI